MTFVLLVAIPFAALRRFSVEYLASLTCLVLLLNSIVAAPYGNRFSISNGSSIENSSVPWKHPCGSPVPGIVLKLPQRHNAHRSLKRVRTQLRVAQNHFKLDLRDVHEIYSKVYNVLKKHYNMHWLPEKHLEWYQREVWCLEKGKKAELALPRLHDALQRFAITFHYLQNFHLYSDINSALTMIRRNEIIDRIHNEVLRMLCEVETAILNLGLEVPETYSTKILTNSTTWAYEGDMTLMLIQDWGVLRLYRIFLQEWMKALRNATAPGTGVCDPTDIKPYQMLVKKKNKKKTAEKKNKLPKMRDPLAVLDRNSSLPLLEQNGSLPVRQRKESRTNRLMNMKRNAASV